MSASVCCASSAACRRGPRSSSAAIFPTSRPTMWARGFAAFGSADMVLGPAADGGYWLIGLSSRARAIDPFQGVRWSSPWALADTARALPAGFRLALVDRLADVDDGPALQNWRARKSATWCWHAQASGTSSPCTEASANSDPRAQASATSDPRAQASATHSISMSNSIGQDAMATKVLRRRVVKEVAPVNLVHDPVIGGVGDEDLALHHAVQRRARRSPACASSPASPARSARRSRPSPFGPSRGRAGAGPRCRGSRPRARKARAARRSCGARQKAWGSRRFPSPPFLLLFPFGRALAFRARQAARARDVPSPCNRGISSTRLQGRQR